MPAVEAHARDRVRGHAQQPLDLLGDGDEHLLGGRGARDDLRHAQQCGLLGRQLAQLLVSHPRALAR